LDDFERVRRGGKHLRQERIRIEGDRGHERIELVIGNLRRRWRRARRGLWMRQGGRDDVRRDEERGARAAVTRVLRLARREFMDRPSRGSQTSPADSHTTLVIAPCNWCARPRPACAGISEGFTGERVDRLREVGGGMGSSERMAAQLASSVQRARLASRASAATDWSSTGADRATPRLPRSPKFRNTSDRLDQPCRRMVTAPNAFARNLKNPAVSASSAYGTKEAYHRSAWQ
jgi:hypothetical protein